MPVHGMRGAAPSAPSTPSSAPAESSSLSDWLLPAAGAAAVAGGAYALKQNPQVIKDVGQGIMDARRMSMLSGLAPLKSLLGNVGGTALTSIERGEMAPLRELFSGQTLSDAAAAFKRGAQYQGNTGTWLTKLNIPGRVMGALDEATTSALTRAGLTPEESATQMLQTPLPKRVASAMDNPVAEFAVPFRRVPFNQLYEGLQSFGANTTGKKVALATAMGSGAATGAVADDPKTVGLGTAAMGRYGLPFAVGAAAARTYRTGKPSEGAKVMTGLSPVSDYSLAQSANAIPKLLEDPTDVSNIVPVPAAVSALKYLRQLVGLE